MNYIKSLQRSLADESEKIAAAQREISDFAYHLQSAKFVGNDIDGQRKDWIAVKDVMNRLSNLRDALNGLA